MKDEIKEILEKFNKEVEKAELTRNPYSNEDKKFKHILVSLSEEHFNIFKDILDYITNLQTIEQQYSAILSENAELENKITNLQEEYNNSQITLAGEWKKRLEVEEKNKHLENQITMLKQQNNAITEMGLDYKSRNEKVIYDLEKTKELNDRHILARDNIVIHLDIDHIEYLLNILKGDNK